VGFSLDFVHVRKWTKRCIRQKNATVDFLHGRMNPPMCSKIPVKAYGEIEGQQPRKTSTPHANRVGGEAASEQAVTYMRDTRALLLRSKKWTKSSFGFVEKTHKPHSNRRAREESPLALPVGSTH